MSFKNFKSFQLAVSFYQGCSPLKMDHDLKRRFLYNAYGSAKECQSILILANIHDPKLIDLIDHISAILYKNIKIMGP